MFTHTFVAAPRPLPLACVHSLLICMAHLFTSASVLKGHASVLCEILPSAGSWGRFCICLYSVVSLVFEFNCAGLLSYTAGVNVFKCALSAYVSNFCKLLLVTQAGLDEVLHPTTNPCVDIVSGSCYQ